MRCRSSRTSTSSERSDGRELGVARGEHGELLAVEEAPHRGELGGELGVGAGGGGLALERAHLAAHLAHEVAEPLEVLLGRRQPPLRPLLAAAVLEHAGGLLDDAAAVLGPGVQDLVELALADDHVVLAADARVAQQLLDVEQPARRAVDRVLGLPVAKERPRDRDLRHVDGELPRGVVDREAHLGAAERGARRGPREDDVLHLLAAQRPRSLGAEDPRHRVDDVRLA